MDITITPSKLSGSVTPPPSKSQAHRLLIAAALADGESVISNVVFSQDIEATLRCLGELGAGFAVDGSTVTVRGMGANSMSPLRRMAYPALSDPHRPGGAGRRDLHRTRAADGAAPEALFRPV